MCKPEFPAVDDLLLAAEWLDNNEGDENESGPCQKVAKWLREYAVVRAEQIDEDRIVTELAKQSGSTVKRAREFWRNRAAITRDKA